MSGELEELSGPSGESHFSDNFVRILGLHALTQNTAAALVGVSGATMSAWMNGKTSPSLTKAIAVAELFQLSANRLMGAEFSELLANELADPERFRQVEERIRRGRSKLHSV
jgi:DNA-binding XRE family transcriptional regulator